MSLRFFANATPDVKVKVYRVPMGEVPITPTECEAWVISGSPKGAYEEDVWISNLRKFIVAADQVKARMLGICFGHQLIAHSLGGRAEKSPKGWGVGVQEFAISDFMPWMDPPLKAASLLFSHQDQVVQLPKGARHLASSEFCRYQMFSVGHHIFSLQGHPEFTPEFARGRLESRKDLIGKSVYDQAVQSLERPTASREIGNWIRRFLDRA